MSFFRSLTKTSDMLTTKYARKLKAALFYNFDTTAESIVESDAVSTSAGSEGRSESVSDVDSDSRCVPVIVSKQHMRLWQRVESQQKRAYKEADIYLVFVYLELAAGADVPDRTVTLLLEAVKLMHQCDFEVQDICCVLAHASAYFGSISSSCGKHMDASERGYILAALIYLAHTYVIDENCPLKFWHERLFRKYSTLKVLDAAVMRMLKLLKYRLRVDEEDLSSRYERLQQAFQGGVVSSPSQEISWV